MMTQTTFGRRTGLRVSEYALGTGGFGGGYTSPTAARQILDRFAEAGGTFVDTADSYLDGESETLVGELLAGRRDDFVLATKYGRVNTAQQPVNRVGNSRRAMTHAVEQSLRRLNTDRIDLYWAHFDDRVTPMDEIVAAFDTLITAGKIRYGGLSNFPAWRVALGQAHAEHHGLASLAGVQVEHSLLERGAETELFPAARDLGLGTACYSPLAGGLLTAKHRTGQNNRPIAVHREDTPVKTRTIDELLAVAKELDAPPGRVAVAWQRDRGVVTVIGPRTGPQLDDYLAALDLRLSPEQVERLDAASEIYRGAPHDGIAGPPDLGDHRRLRPWS